MTSPVLPNSVAFPGGELALALSEQSFGISSYEITGSTDVEATARVVLLEREAVSISLTTRGYTVQSDPGPGAVFETLDDLLQSISGLYRDARHKALMDKLAALQ